MGFDPNAPSELVSRGFDPSAPSEPLPKGPTGPILATPEGGVAIPPPKTPPTDFAALYGGLDGLQTRLTPEQNALFDALDKVSPNPKEARAKAINQLYLEQQGVPKAAIDSGWQAAKETYAKQVFGLEHGSHGITDEKLYGYIQAKIQDEADPGGWGGGTTEGRENWDTLPLTHLGGQIDTSKMPHGPGYFAASVWNGVQPALEQFTSVESLASASGAGALAKAETALAVPVLKGMAGLFGALVTKYAVQEIPGTFDTITSKDATSGEKVTAVTSNVVRWMMAFASYWGAFSKAGVKPKVTANTVPGTAAAIEAEIPKAPMDAVPPMRAAVDQLRDLEKTAPKVIEKTEAAKAWDEVRKIFNAAGRSPQAAITAGALREHGAELSQRIDRADARLKAASKALMKMDPAERWAVVDRIETGQHGPWPSPELQQFADAVRDIMDTKRDEIRALGTGKLEHFIKDYFPHIWKDPDEAATALQKAVGKAPMQGSKAFLKQRSIPTIAEGLRLGLTPVSTNPVELLLLKAREMDKYILGHKWLQEMKERGFVTYVKAGEEAPEGYAKINDPIATVYGPKKGAVAFDPEVNPKAVSPEQVTVFGRRTMGEYWAPEEIATVANNYLSPGLRRSALFRGYLTASNSLNQFQLGLSAFHLGFTSLDTSISKLALALEYAKEGRPLEAAKAAAKVPVAPISNFLQGNRVLEEWLRPGTQGEEIAQIADAVKRAGGRAKMDALYQTSIAKRMGELWNEGGLSRANAIWRAPFAAMEQLSKPLMEYLVPRQKLGVAADLMRKEMERLGPDASVEDMRAAFGRAWDSVDNRMGQLVYDNLFWHKAVKDLAMAGVRSVGWDLGTIRELGGGVKDSVKYVKDALTPKEKAEFTHRMAYMIALPTLTGVVGATYQYLKTGKGPEELRDYFFPKTGEKDPQGRDVRLAMPSYMKDVYHYAHAPWATLEGKVSPFPALVMQMLNNKDFYGHDIRNADDPLVKQMADEVGFFLKSYEPIGVRQFTISSAAGQTAGEKAANFVGVTRAPAWVGESAAEQLAGQLAGDKFKGAGTEDADRAAKINQAREALRSGDQEKAERIFAQLSDQEKLTPIQKRNIVRGTEHTYLENATAHLTIDGSETHGPLWRVFRVATKAEREAIADHVLREINRARITDEDRDKLRREFDRLMPSREIDYSAR
jgi:hypothetical protein